jgi:uncharacterized protein (TIGR02145 family)
MKLYILIFFFGALANTLFAQGVTKNGNSTYSGTPYVDQYGKIRYGMALNKNGKIITLYDVENNEFTTVTIGTQTWMAENLKTTKYNDGTDIPLVTDGITWGTLTTPAYCWYSNDINNKPNYGALYNWYAVNTGKLCPSGWHVPTDGEWSTLEIYLQNNDYNYNGVIDTDADRATNNYTAKSLGFISGWNSTGITGTIGYGDFPTYRNKSGFSGLPAGYRVIISSGAFTNAGTNTMWWSSTIYSAGFSIFRGLINNYTYVNRSNTDQKMGFSVRCLKN